MNLLGKARASQPQSGWQPKYLKQSELRESVDLWCVGFASRLYRCASSVSASAWGFRRRLDVPKLVGYRWNNDLFKCGIWVLKSRHHQHHYAELTVFPPVRTETVIDPRRPKRPLEEEEESDDEEKQLKQMNTLPSSLLVTVQRCSKDFKGLLATLEDLTLDLQQLRASWWA